ncbi:glutathione S-transferase family protein [Chelativorans salis]|uniref:Glutathione S-transferase N-terminal domain-containing protein n=1 Tax=Chelativorans salis TaxID=2978478 RepID=A0ABT2LU27_9HYPH|nr:glutathione S-transferase N-terminal domain-containing protein [Chelativorans sp. EGI FJ00035]MCT7378035.1 glutathione S-transferase N-terminal domain-containing protein [Chelativorans sp. EGI FJ00035]
MIDLYTWTTPNGRKISIFLEELGIDYEVHPVNLREDEQKTPEFLKIGPNNKIPVIVDRETGLSLMESGAILWYLAGKYGRFLPTDTKARMTVLQWLMWQMGGLGPMAGQAHHYVHHNPGKYEYPETKLSNEVNRLYGVLDRRLEGRDYICDEYTIADVACWPWVSRYEWHGVDLSRYPNVRNWYRRILQREAVRTGYHIPHFVNEIPQG